MIFEQETIHFENKNGIDVISLPDLTPAMELMLNPLIPPTSGLRMKIYEERENSHYFMPKDKQFLFFRAFRAISEVAKGQISKSRPGVLLVSDDRPSSSYLVKIFAKILAYDGYQIYFQTPTDPVSMEAVKTDPYYSRMGTPHGSASVVLFDEVDLAIVITASHNEIDWNGIKIYIERSIPISGKVMKAISEKSLTYTEILGKTDFQVGYLDANARNNEYILKIVQEIMDLSILSGKKVLLWPYMGLAPELQDLFSRVGMEVIVVPDDMEPPNPTVNIDLPKLTDLMKKHQVNVGILLDTDRDRIVFALYHLEEDEIEIFQPNTLYTAMHNILTKEMGIPIVNVRTIPSDPRADSNAQLTFATGVGYKHLGMILNSALGYSLETEQFQTGILYLQTPEGYRKCTSPLEIREAFATLPPTITKVFVGLWEESGGHTFNVLDIIRDTSNSGTETQNSSITLQPCFPPIGDKYPAEALLILTALIELGYNFHDYVDRSIDGTRAMIQADDTRKLRIVEHFTSQLGQTFPVGDELFQISSFEQINGTTAIIHLFNSDTKTDVYFRPSGTGPGVRIYIFGPKSKIDRYLSFIQNKIDNLIP
ncbi:MAG: hypothetical protein ACTSYI_14080 [Promethearchaeota archaeon]